MHLLTDERAMLLHHKAWSFIRDKLDYYLELSKEVRDDYVGKYPMLSDSSKRLTIIAGYIRDLDPVSDDPSVYSLWTHLEKRGSSDEHWNLCHLIAKLVGGHEDLTAAELLERLTL